MARKPKHRTYPDALSCQQALRAATPTLAEDVRQGRIADFPPRGSTMSACHRRDCANLLYPNYYVATFIDRRHRLTHQLCADCRQALLHEESQAWERYERQRADQTLDLEIARDTDARRRWRDAVDQAEAQLDPRREVSRFRYLAVRSKPLTCRMGSARALISSAPLTASAAGTGAAENFAELAFATALVYADGAIVEQPDPDPAGPAPDPAPAPSPAPRNSSKPRASRGSRAAA